YTAARLLGEEHAEPGITPLTGIGAREQGHQIGAAGVCNPGLRAIDAVNFTIPHGACLKAGEVGTCVRLGKYRRRQYRDRSDSWQPSRLLRIGPIEADQFAGNLRAGPERSNPDIGPRQLFGNDAHRDLAEPEPAMFLGDRHRENADPGELFDYRKRY